MKLSAPSHPKMFGLADLLGIQRYAAAGLMELLWHYAGHYAPTGDLTSCPLSAIAAAVGWEKKPAELIAAAVQAGFLDWVDAAGRRLQPGAETWDPPAIGARLVIHDWHEHAEDWVRKWLERNGKTFWNGAPPRGKKAAAESPPEEADASSAAGGIDEPGGNGSAKDRRITAGEPPSRRCRDTVEPPARRRFDNGRPAEAEAEAQASAEALASSAEIRGRNGRSGAQTETEIRDGQRPARTEAGPPPTASQIDRLTADLMRVLKIPRPEVYPRRDPRRRQAKADRTDIARTIAPAMLAHQAEAEVIDRHVHAVATADNPIAALKERLKKDGILPQKAAGRQEQTR